MVAPFGAIRTTPEAAIGTILGLLLMLVILWILDKLGVFGN